MRTFGRSVAVLAATVAATVSVLVGAPAASAAVEGRIDSSVADDEAGTLALAFSALGLQPGDTLDPASVKTLVNGTEVRSTAQKFDPTAGQKRISVLTIDVSSSMGNGTGRMEAAKLAANTYLDSIPDDVAVGLVTFGNEVTDVVQPTTDHAAVKAAVDALQPGGGTPLYDAVVAGVQMLGLEGIRSQLLISDGGDQDSTEYTAQTAAAEVKNSGSTLDAVALGDDAGTAELALLAEAGNGKVITLSGSDFSQQLSDAFASSAQAAQQQLQVTAYIPAEFANTGQTVTVSVNSSQGEVRADTYAFMPANAAAPVDPTEEYGPVAVPTPDPGIFGQTWFLWLILAMVAVGLFTLLAVALLATDRDSRESGRVRRRLSRYSLTPRTEASSEAAPTALGENQVARSAVELAGRVVQGRDLDTTLSTKLDAAGVPLRPAEWMLIHIGITVGAGLLFTLVSQFNWLATLIGLLLGLIGPWIYLSIKEDRRKSAFAAQLPETLQLLAGSLAAGYSLPQAVDAVVREADGAMATELNRAIIEARLGVPMEDALEGVAIRMNSVDFAWVVMAIRIQREVGGNLSEVLSNVAATMRERERLRRQVEVLSAEGRLSAVILGLLPILFIVYLVIARPDYLAVLVTTPLGLVMIVVGILLLIAGVFWLRATVKVEV